MSLPVMPINPDHSRLCLRYDMIINDLPTSKLFGFCVQMMPCIETYSCGWECVRVGGWHINHFRARYAWNQCHFLQKIRYPKKWDGPFLSIFNFMIHNSTFSPRFTNSTCFFKQTFHIFFAISKRHQASRSWLSSIAEPLSWRRGGNVRTWAGGLETKNRERLFY